MSDKPIETSILLELRAASLNQANAIMPTYPDSHSSSASGPLVSATANTSNDSVLVDGQSCDIELVPDMSFWPLVGVLCALLAALAWDTIAYHILGYVPPFRKPPLAAPNEPPPTLTTEPFLGASSTSASAKPDGPGIASDATEDADEVEQANFKSKTPLVASISVLMLVADAAYGLPISYLPCFLAGNGSDQLATGVVVSSFGGGVMLGALIAPLILRRVSLITTMRSTILPVGCTFILFGLGGALSDPTAMVVTLCIARFLFGFGMVLNETAAQAMMFRMVTKDQITAANAFMMSVRLLGQLGSPVVGALLYSAGGAPAPMLFGAILFVVLYLAFVGFVLPHIGDALDPKPDPNQPTILTIWSVCPAWIPFLMAMLMHMLQLGLEPIYSPVLTSAPYLLNFIDVGAWTLIFPISAVITATLFSSQLYKKIGVVAQLSIATCTATLGILLFGPSTIFPIDPSFGTLTLSLILMGAGTMSAWLLTPIMLMDILWRRARLSKKDLAGSLVASNMFLLFAMGLISPILSSSLYEYTGNDIRWWSTIQAIIFLVVSPILIILIRYELPPSLAFGSCCSKPKATDQGEEFTSDKSYAGPSTIIDERPRQSEVYM